MGASSTARHVNRNWPSVMRETSSRSSISAVCALALRSITSSAFARAWSSNGRVRKQRDPADDGVQRRAQLVRERAEKVVLDAIGLVRVVARALLERDRVPQRALRAAQTQQRVRGRDEDVRRYRLDENGISVEAVVVEPVGVSKDPQDHCVGEFFCEGPAELRALVVVQGAVVKGGVEHEEFGLRLTQQCRIGQMPCVEHRMSSVPQSACSAWRVSERRGPRTRMRRPSPQPS